MTAADIMILMAPFWVLFAGMLLAAIIHFRNTRKYH